MFVEDQPGHCPGEAQHAGDDERHLPAVHHDCPHYQRRCNHRTNRRTDVKVTHSDGTFFRREPLGRRFQACRDHCRFRRAYCATGQRQTAPAACQRSRAAEYRPQNGKHRIADFGAQYVKDVASNRLHECVSRRIGRDNIGILLSGDV